MNYTENYHLPQWEETDRIMRADFNQMCADIEEGMSENREVGEELAQRITAAEAGAVGAAQAGLFRLAYNHWHYLDALASKPRQMGFFQQSFGKNQTAVEGMLQLDDCCWMANGDEELSMDNIRPNLTVSGSISTSAKTKSTSATFVAPYGGQLKNIYLTGNYSLDQNVRMPYTLTITEDGVQIYNNSSTTFFSSGNSTGRYCWSANVMLHAGRLYHITVSTTSLPTSVNFRFDKNDTALDVSGYRAQAASVSRQIQEEEPSQGGLILVQYDHYRSENGLTLDWGGETMSPTVVRTITNRAGRKVKEAEFRLSGTVSADTTITLHLNCAPGGEIFLYAWGGLLI